MADSPPSAAIEIELTESESIALRGAHFVRWKIRKADAWIDVSDWPAAEVRALKSQQVGVVWERRITLRVNEGARLLKIETIPGAANRKQAPKSPLDLLLLGKHKPAQQMWQKYYQVGPRGTLVPAH